MSQEESTKFFIFEGADTDVTYTIKVTLVLNGKTIADSQKTLKALSKDNNNEKPLGITQELDIKEYL